jgi:hypothetical protein
MPISQARVARRDRAGETLDRVFIGAIAACVAATLLLVLAGIHGHATLPAVDLVVDTVALVACALVTALAWTRFREHGVIAALYHAAAFLALAVAYGLDPCSTASSTAAPSRARPSPRASRRWCSRWRSWAPRSSSWSLESSRDGGRMGGAPP